MRWSCTSQSTTRKICNVIQSDVTNAVSLNSVWYTDVLQQVFYSHTTRSSYYRQQTRRRFMVFLSQVGSADGWIKVLINGCSWLTCSLGLNKHFKHQCGGWELIQGWLVHRQLAEGPKGDLSELVLAWCWTDWGWRDWGDMHSIWGDLYPWYYYYSNTEQKSGPTSWSAGQWWWKSFAPAF